MINKIKDKTATILFWVSGLLILAILAWFLSKIIIQGLPSINLKFLISKPSEMDVGGGIGPMIFNTFYILILSLTFALPIGIGAGIYLSEFSKNNRVTKLIRLAVECLASVPSIVFGLFGMIIFVVKFGFGFSILGGSATLALLNLPVIVRVTEESIKMVPNSYRESSYAMGATQWQTIIKIVLPACVSDLITGINLVAGRAVGESAVLIFTAGTSIARHFPNFNPLSSGEALSVHLWYVKAVGLVPDADKVAAGTATVLILIILIFNLVMKLLSYNIKRKFQGA